MRFDKSGTNGLIVGKKAIRLRGCPGCGGIGSSPLMLVRTVTHIEPKPDTLNCLTCKCIVIATRFYTDNDESGVTFGWELLQDLDETEELKQLEEIEA